MTEKHHKEENDFMNKSFRKTQAFYRLMRLKWYRKRVKAVEKELGEKIHCC